MTSEMFEQSVGQIITKAAEAYRDEIDLAVDMAEKELARQPGWEEYKLQLIRNAVRGLIHQYRHLENVKQRRETGQYGGEAKTTRGKASAEVAKQKTLYEYFIGGRILGSTTGEELCCLASSEMEKAKGYIFNARLCEALSRIVPKQKTVQEAVTEKKLNSIWHQVKNSMKQQQQKKSA